MRPVDTDRAAFFLAGCAQGPKDIPDTVAQAKAAASSAMIVVRQAARARRATVGVPEGVVEVEG
jgi:heterodisulfide reductase subunit A